MSVEQELAGLRRDMVAMATAQAEQTKRFDDLAAWVKAHMPQTSGFVERAGQDFPSLQERIMSGGYPDLSDPDQVPAWLREIELGQTVIDLREAS